MIQHVIDAHVPREQVSGLEFDAYVGYAKKDTDREECRRTPIGVRVQ